MRNDAAFLAGWFAGCNPDHWFQLFARDRYARGSGEVFGRRIGDLSDERTARDLHAWVEAQLEDERNIGFSPNPLRYRCESKWATEDVAEVWYCHTDTDCRDKGKATYGKFEETLDALKLSRPRFIIATGNGYHPAWRLRSPIILAEGDTEAQALGRQFNVEMKRRFSGDAAGAALTFNARLPGTINFPDEHKKRKLRESGEIVIDDDTIDRHYWQDVKLVHEDPGATIAPEITGSVMHVPTLPELSPQLRAELGNVVQKRGENDYKPQPIEADRLDAAIDGLLKTGLPDEAVEMTLAEHWVETDPSTEAQERQDGGDRYAVSALKGKPIRLQIEARRRAITSALVKSLNRNHYKSRVGGKPLIVAESVESYGPGVPPRKVREYLSLPAFKQSRDRQVWVGTNEHGQDEYIGEGALYLANPLKRNYPGGMRLDPLGPKALDGGDVLNLWQGFSVQPRRGDCSLFRQHVDRICETPEQARYMWLWLAWAVQNPDSPAGVLLMMRGKQGAGKGTIASTFGRLFGQHFVQVFSERMVSGNFNRHLEDAIVLFADESLWGGDIKAVGTIKGLVTEPQIMIEPKGVDAYPVKNRLHIIGASNESWAIAAGEDDRRMCVLDVSGDVAQSAEYFDPLYRQLEDGGLEALLWDLQHEDLTDFNIRAFPRTAALAEMQTHSMSPVRRWLLAKLEAGYIGNFPINGDDIPKDAAWNDFRAGGYGGAVRGDMAFKGELRKLFSQLLGEKRVDRKRLCWVTRNDAGAIDRIEPHEFYLKASQGRVFDVQAEEFRAHALLCLPLDEMRECFAALMGPAWTDHEWPEPVEPGRLSDSDPDTWADDAAQAYAEGAF